jgi:hypothetical protein
MNPAMVKMHAYDYILHSLTNSSYFRCPAVGWVRTFTWHSSIWATWRYRICLGSVQKQTACVRTSSEFLFCGFGLVSLVSRTVWSNTGMATCAAAIPCGKCHYCIEVWWPITGMKHISNKTVLEYPGPASGCQPSVSVRL